MASTSTSPRTVRAAVGRHAASFAYAWGPAWVASLVLLACGPVSEVAEARAAATACPWDPVFGTRSCTQGDWWMEFSVRDSTVARLDVEVSGMPVRTVNLPTRSSLRSGYYKFAGGTDSPVPAGTSIRLKATQSAAAGGRVAYSGWFGYRTGTPAVACGSCTPSCAPGTCGGDGCGGTCACPVGMTCTAGQCTGGCVAPWNPSWQQTTYAGAWWAEYYVLGESLARSVTLEVPGSGSYPLSLSYGKWVGGLDGVTSGTAVVLHATDATGATARTSTFRYLADANPPTDPLSAAALDDELRTSKQYLLANVGSPVESIASPMGSYDATVVNAMKGYYLSHRTVNVGLNYMGNSVYELNADGVYNTSTASSVCAQLTEAALYRGWRILVFHDFTTAASSNSSLLYPISSFAGILQCAQATPGLDVVTVREGAAKLRCASP